MTTDVEREIAESQVWCNDQSVTIRVGDRWNRHEETFEGVYVGQIIARLNRGIIGFCVINDQRYPVRFLGGNRWRLND